MADEDEAKWRALLQHANAIDPTHGSDLATEAWISLRNHFARRGVPYLVGAVRNLHRSRMRRDQRRARREHDWSSALERPALEPIDELERRELLDALQVLLHKLDESQLRLLRDRYVDGRTSQQIATREEASANTIRWRLKALLAQLRLQLTEFLEVSMTPDREVIRIVRAIENCLDDLSDDWSGRLVVHLAPSRDLTKVEKLEFIPAAPRGTTSRLQRRIRAEILPGCSVSKPFEMHFECTPG